MQHEDGYKIGVSKARGDQMTRGQLTIPKWKKKGKINQTEPKSKINLKKHTSNKQTDN